ncbi:hypothetical protein AC578_7497 [Pseudocercospora eumusae]|uniref:Uncharacterized protein n=1 Tax=Pseudocercospora eumusae TaxID=321146 RepID=A0A139GWE2_9PEZI|nr:hypothetical protein AC578_7497 [Pseudocercospora eumusae]
MCAFSSFSFFDKNINIFLLSTSNNSVKSSSNLSDNEQPHARDRNAIKQILSDFDTQAIGQQVRYNESSSPRSDVASRAKQVRQEILEALEPVQVAAGDADILHHWNRQHQHIAASRRNQNPKQGYFYSRLCSQPPAVKVSNARYPEARAISGETHGDGDDRGDSTLALEWDASQEWCASDADLEEVLERQDAITKLLTKAQKSGKRSTFSPEAFDEGLQFTLRAYGKDDKLPYPDLWVPDPRSRYKDEAAIGDLEESRVIRVFFAKSLEDASSPTRGRSRYWKRFMGEEKTDKEKDARPSFVAAGKYYACTHKLSPPTMAHPALRQLESPKQDGEKDEPLQHMNWQPPRYLPLSKRQPTKHSTFTPGLPAILERVKISLFPLKKARASPKVQL